MVKDMGQHSGLCNASCRIANRTLGTGGQQIRPRCAGIIDPAIKLTHTQTRWFQGEQPIWRTVGEWSCMAGWWRAHFLTEMQNRRSWLSTSYTTKTDQTWRRTPIRLLPPTSCIDIVIITGRQDIYTRTGSNSSPWNGKKTSKRAIQLRNLSYQPKKVTTT